MADRPTIVVLAKQAIQFGVFWEAVVVEVLSICHRDVVLVIVTRYNGDVSAFSVCWYNPANLC